MTPKAIYIFIKNNKTAQMKHNEWWLDGNEDGNEEEDQQMMRSGISSELSSLDGKKWMISSPQYSCFKTWSGCGRDNFGSLKMPVH